MVSFSSAHTDTMGEPFHGIKLPFVIPVTRVIGMDGHHITKNNSLNI